MQREEAAVKDDLSFETNPIEYMLALADALDHGEEITLGPTDKEICAEAVRNQAVALKAKG